MYMCDMLYVYVCFIYIHIDIGIYVVCIVSVYTVYV